MDAHVQTFPGKKHSANQYYFVLRGSFTGIFNEWMVRQTDRQTDVSSRAIAASSQSLFSLTFFFANHQSVPPSELRFCAAAE